MEAKQLIRELKARQGHRSLRQFARELGISAAYLSDIYLGRREPGPKLLEPLGLSKRVERRVDHHKAPRVSPVRPRGDDSDLDFHPVEIRGEPLSTTILRERR
ncbi:MAG: helix-turn-helix transcriptional regulator [Terriglobales bacterium]